MAIPFYIFLFIWLPVSRLIDPNPTPIFLSLFSFLFSHIGATHRSWSKTCVTRPGSGCYILPHVGAVPVRWKVQASGNSRWELELEIKNEGVYNFRVNYLDYSCSYEKRASRDCPAAATAATGRPRKTGQVHTQQQQQKRVGPGSIVRTVHIFIHSRSSRVEYFWSVWEEEKTGTATISIMYAIIWREKNSLFPRHLFVRIRRETQHGQ